MDFQGLRCVLFVGKDLLPYFSVCVSSCLLLIPDDHRCILNYFVLIFALLLIALLSNGSKKWSC